MLLILYTQTPSYAGMGLFVHKYSNYSTLVVVVVVEIVVAVVAGVVPCCSWCIVGKSFCRQGKTGAG